MILAFLKLLLNATFKFDKQENFLKNQDIGFRLLQKSNKTVLDYLSSFWASSPVCEYSNI